MANDRPIAWLALEPGTPIISTEGQQVGKVADVIADRGKDIFSGITFKPGLLDSAVFVPADQVVEITEASVTLSLSESEVAQLEAYDS